MASPSEVFRGRLREVRRLKGWTQQQLAEALAEIGVRIDASAITRLERGTRGVTLDDVVSIAAALDVSPLHLFDVARKDRSMAVHFEHAETIDGPVSLRCDTYGDFLSFVACARILTSYHHVTMADWDYVAEHGKPPPESADSRALSASREFQSAFMHIGALLDKHLNWPRAERAVP